MRRLVHRAALVAVLGALLLGPTAAVSAQDAEAPRLALLDRTAWVGDGLDFLLSVQVTGAPADAVVRLTVHDRVRSRIEFARSVLGEGLRSRVYRPPDAPLTEMSQPNGTFTVVVPFVARPELGVEPVTTITRPGVYPVVLEVRSADGDDVLAALHTHLVRLPALDPDDDAVPLDAVVVVPVEAPPAHLTVGPPAVPDAPLTELAAVLAQHPDVPVTLAPRPETIAAAASADADAVAALTSTLGGRQVVGGPWVGIDEAAWSRADAAELRRQLDRGRQTLLDVLGVSVDGTRVLAAGATAAHVEVASANGATAVVLEEADLVPLDPDDFTFTLTRPFAVDAGETAPFGLPALAADAALRAHAADAEADPVLAAHLVLADLAVLAGDQPALRRAATLVLPPEAARSPAFLDALLGGLEPPAAPPAPVPSLDPAVPTPAATPAAAPLVVGRTVAEALAAVEPAGHDGEPDPAEPLVRPLASTDEPAGVGDVARQLGTVRADVGSYEATFGADDDLTEQLTLLLATAPAADLGDRARTDALAAATAAVEQALAGLHPPESQQVRLTAREGRVQLVLVNDTGRTAQVTLVLRGDRLVLPDAPDGRLPITLTEATTRVDLRVEARSSGDASLDVVLVTPDERIELGRARVIVRATAVSGVGVVLLGASAAFLVVWWTRTIVKERRTARGRHPAHARGRRHPPAATPRT